MVPSRLQEAREPPIIPRLGLNSPAMMSEASQILDISQRLEISEGLKTTLIHNAFTIKP
jgi:hypothetical protein